MEKTFEDGENAWAKVLWEHGEFKGLKNGYCCWSKHMRKNGSRCVWRSRRKWGTEGKREADPAGMYMSVVFILSRVKSH